MERPAPPTIRVVAAVVERDGRYLITQRRPSAVLPLLWEFPGGRVEADETDSAALRREVKHRLGVDVEVGQLISFVSHPYEKYVVDLYLYECHLCEGEPTAQNVHSFQWVSSAEFDRYPFTPADEASMTKLLGVGLWRLGPSHEGAVSPGARIKPGAAAAEPGGPEGRGGRFDEAYFRRYYGDDSPARVHGIGEVVLLARAVVSLAGYWGWPLHSALDVGAGTGLWREALAREAPELDYRGVDVSPLACERYGHEPRDISRWRARSRFDLVICQGVLQYLADEPAAAAVENLAAMTKGLLFFEALTRNDLEQVADRQRTDADVFLRTGAWYRARLRPHFLQVGAGLFCKRDSGLLFFELERSGA